MVERVLSAGARTVMANSVKTSTATVAAEPEPIDLDWSTTALLIIENPDQNLYLASRNHPHLVTVTGDLVNAEQLLLCDKVFITDGALGKLSARLQK